MQHQTTMGVFRSPQYTLVSSLSADECLNRLRTEVTAPYGCLASFAGTWRPLALDPTIWRKTHGHHFQLYRQSTNPRNPWRFYGTVRSRADGTTITGHYRSLSVLWVLAGLTLAYGLYLMSGSLLGVPVFVLGRDAGWQLLPLSAAVALGLGVPAILIGVYALNGLTHRKVHRQEAQQFLSVLQTLLTAEPW